MNDDDYALPPVLRRMLRLLWYRHLPDEGLGLLKRRPENDPDDDEPEVEGT